MSIAPDEISGVTRRFLVLKFVHALSDGFQLPVKILILSARGLSLLVIVALELPTGGLADSWGRRRVLITAAAANLVGVGLLAFGSSFSLLLVGIGLSGVARALGSGPLEAWYVDEVRSASPDAELTGPLGRAASVENGALAIGALCGGALPLVFASLASSGSNIVLSFSISLIAALVLISIELAALYLLMDEGTIEGLSLRRSAADVPSQISAGIATASKDATIRAVLAQLVLAGVALAAFEIFVPLRLVETGLQEERAATVFGLMVTAGFVGRAATAPLSALLKRVVGNPVRGAGVSSAAAGAFGLIVLAPSAIAVVVGYLSKLAMSGPIMPLIGGAVHERVRSQQRATLLSMLSLSAMLGAGLGSVLLTQLADRSSISWALGIGGTALIAGGMLLLPARLGESTSADDVRRP